MENMKKYVYFELAERKPKTSVFHVRAKSDGTFLGAIYWYFPWRGYVFEPDAGTIWSKGCLQQVKEFLEELMKERKEETEKCH
jgi:hypothetical protein